MLKNNTVLKSHQAIAKSSTCSKCVIVKFLNAINIDKYNPYKQKFFWGPPYFYKVERGSRGGKKSLRDTSQEDPNTSQEDPNTSQEDPNFRFILPLFSFSGLS